MKKVVSLILILTLAFALSTGAFATTTTTHVVGNSPDEGLISDGVADFNPANSACTISIDVRSSTVNHRYAVDVDYSTDAVTIGGANVTWNVNTMRYEATEDASGVGSVSVFKEITITNYSDLSIQAYAEIDDLDENDFLNLDADATAGSVLVVGAATAGTSGTNGTATAKTINIELKPSDSKTWSDVVSYYGSNIAPETSQTVATATIYIEKYTSATP